MSTGTDANTMDTRRNNEHRILVIGKAGNGKSSFCNTLCGSPPFDPPFETGRGLAVTTRTAQSHDVHRYGYHIRVVDTPDISNLNMTPGEMQKEVSRWRQLTHPNPTAVLLTVRCDVRYTAEEYAIYRQILNLWGDNSLKERLVVAFTFGDRQDNDLEDELRTVCRELKNVLSDAGNHYVMFTNKGPAQESEVHVQRLLTMLETLSVGGTSKFKYASLALTATSFTSGLIFAATFTAAKFGPAIFFGLLCLASMGGVVFLRIKEKMH